MGISQLLFLVFLVNVCKGVADSRSSLVEIIVNTKTGLSKGGTTCRTGEVRCSDCKTSEVCAGPWKGWVKIKCPHKEFCDPMRPDKGCLINDKNTCNNEDPPVDDNFICTSDGFHPLFEDISQYRLCIGGDAYILYCKGGQLYDQNMGGCVDKEPFFENRTSSWNFENPCWEYKRTGLFPNPDCRSSYIYCFPLEKNSQMKYITFNCPSGEVFERSKDLYDREFMGKCVPDCKEETNLPVQGDCRQYVSCVRKGTDFQRVTMTCPGNTWYDPYRKRCGFRKPNDSC